MPKDDKDRRDPLDKGFLEGDLGEEPPIDAATHEMLKEGAVFQGKTKAQIKKILKDRERVRKTIDIDKALKELLEAAAGELSVSESNLIAWLAFEGLKILEAGEIGYKHLLVSAYSPKVDWKIDYGLEVDEFAKTSKFARK